MVSQIWEDSRWQAVVHLNSVLIVEHRQMALNSAVTVEIN